MASYLALGVALACDLDRDLVLSLLFLRSAILSSLILAFLVGHLFAKVW